MMMKLIVLISGVVANVEVSPLPEPPLPTRVEPEPVAAPLRPSDEATKVTAQPPTAVPVGKGHGARAASEGNAYNSVRPTGDDEVLAVSKPVARDEEDQHLSKLSRVIISEICKDPFAVTCAVLAVAYLLQTLMVKPKAKEVVPLPEPKPEPAVSERSRRSSSKTHKSQLAISLNQKIMRLHNADEVIDFALTNTVAGKTDIVNVVTAIHRSAKLASGGARKRIAQDPRVTQLLNSLDGFLQERPPLPILSRAVGNTSWALAKLQYPDEGHPILASLESAFVENAQGFRPEELMNTVWAFAELRGTTSDSGKKEGQGRALNVARAAVACSDKFPEFTLQQVVYFAWALARLSQIAAVRNSSDVRAGLLCLQHLIFERVASEVHLLNTKNLAMVCWAVAHVHSKVGGSKEQVSQLLTRIAGHVLETRELEAFFPGEIASILWALNKVHVDYPVFFKRFRDHILRHGLQGYNSQDIANITCAYVNTKTGDDEIYLALADAANARASSFNRSERMMMHWAFSQIPHLPAPRLAGP